MLNKYIRDKDLQDPKDKRKINANPELATLLGLKEGQELTYFNLQTFMAGLYTRKAAATASA